MSDDKERRDKALVPQSTRGLITRSTSLVRRGLDDLAKSATHLTELDVNTLAATIAESDPWEELRGLAKELWLESSLEINAAGMEFMLIQAGSFAMGSDLKEDEKPIHEVTISKPFYMGRHPVTQSQWQQIMGNNPSEFIGDDSPVHCVSWNDAQEFIRRLNLLEAEEPHVTHFEGSRYEMAFEYRLPTEAEWEYACRARTTGDFAGPLDSIAWYVRPLAGSCPPRAVGTKEANAFGLYDMHGNVWEWCHDFYDGNYYSSSPSEDPQGPRSGQYRVLRGGSWNCAFATALRSANRYGSTPDARVNDIGFRVVAVGRTQ